MSPRTGLTGPTEMCDPTAGAVGHNMSALPGFHYLPVSPAFPRLGWREKILEQAKAFPVKAQRPKINQGSCLL